MIHKYSVGRLVHAAGTQFADRTGGTYEVIRFMPESDGEFGYRIKSTTGGTDRAAGESQIRAVGSGPGVPGRLLKDR
jgi:hypothetical protein